MNKFSSGVIERPQNSNTLIIKIRNNLNCLVFKTIRIYDLDNDNPILFVKNNYFINPNGSIEIEIPLISNCYCDICHIDKFEIIYEPFDANVPLEFSFN